jgi:hypothetical protein
MIQFYSNENNSWSSLDIVKVNKNAQEIDISYNYDDKGGFPAFKYFANAD